MRGIDLQQSTMFSYLSPESRVPKDHPMRPIRRMVDRVLTQLSPRFDAMYSKFGRPSIAPEKLLRALLLQVLYTVRSERLLMEQMDYNLLFRWFVGLNMDEAVWVPTVFSKNRDRLLEGEVAQAFMVAVLELARADDLLSDEHFTVDGTLLEAWASLKSFQRKDKPANPGAGEDPGESERKLSRREAEQRHARISHGRRREAGHKKGRGKEAKLAYCGNLLMENRHGLIVDTELLLCSGTAERDAASLMVERIEGSHRVTVGADKGYDTRDFVAEMRQMKATPHVAQNEKRTGGSAVDGRTTRHPGYGISQRFRQRIEEGSGWMKTIGLLDKLRHRGVERVAWIFQFTAVAYNLVRMRSLLPTAVQAA